MGEITKGSQRNKTVDIAKLIFVLGVFYMHLNRLRQPDEAKAFIFGFLGVEFFFIVSGYLMALKANRDSSEHIGKATARFLFRKIQILLPYFIPAQLIGFIVLNYNQETDTIIRNFFMSIPDTCFLQMAGFSIYKILSPTWYLSAMLLAMLVLYPLLLKKKENFCYIWAPIIVVFVYGYVFSKSGGSLSVIDPFEGDIIYAGTLRAFAGISLGCVLFAVVEKLKKLQIKKLLHGIFIFLEIACYGTALFLMRAHSMFRPDFVVLMLFIVAVSISFSGHGLEKHLSKIVKVNWIGKLSTILYFTDAIAITLAVIILPNKRFAERIIPCLIIYVIIAALIWVLSILFNLLLKIAKEKGAKLLVEENKANKD